MDYFVHHHNVQKSHMLVHEDRSPLIRRATRPGMWHNKWCLQRHISSHKNRAKKKMYNVGGCSLWGTQTRSIIILHHCLMPSPITWKSRAHAASTCYCILKKNLGCLLSMRNYQHKHGPSNLSCFIKAFCGPNVQYSLLNMTSSARYSALSTSLCCQ
jgi:hypothetical protein